MMRLHFIDRIAVELEGGWCAQPRGGYGDGSVTDFRGMWSGEIASDHRTIGRLPKLIPWLLENYPDKVDTSCGFHIHMSFKEKAYYEMIMTHTFPMWVVACASKWAKARGLWNTDENLRRRIVSGNDYCHRVYRAESQVEAREKGGDRYTQVNYCYALHRTVELRMMPMFKERKLAAEWLVYYVNCVEEFLRRAKRDTKEFMVEVTLRDAFLREQEELCV